MFYKIFKKRKKEKDMQKISFLMWRKCAEGDLNLLKKVKKIKKILKKNPPPPSP